MQFVPQYDEFMVYTTPSDIYEFIDSVESLNSYEAENIYITCIERFGIGHLDLIKECIDGEN